MSSHHVVRDEQEPALIIVGLETLGEDLLGSLLEWSPTVIVIDSALSAVLQLGIKIDMVICSSSANSSLKQLLISQAPVKLLTYNEGEDPMIVAFYFLLANKYHSVNIMYSLSEEEFLKEYKELFPFANSLDLVFFINKYKGIIPKGEVFEKWVARNQEFKIVPIEEEVQIQRLDSENKVTNDDIISSVFTFTSGNEGMLRLKKTRGQYLLLERL
jgi:thiamine pyrophosphokinase